MATARKTSSSTKTRSPATSGPRLTLRDLNRATLARQMLLAREPGDATGVAARLVGLQAQFPGPPHIGLWTRLAELRRADVAALVASHTLVRATAMRGTLHLIPADDFAQFRPVLQPMLSKALASFDRAKGLDVDALVRDAREILKSGPLTFEAIRQALSARHPEIADVRIMGYAVRLSLPLVQTPGKGAWGFASEPDFALAETWIGRPLATSQDPRELVKRYLAAFGPATARDAQTWSGLGGLGDTFEALRPELVALTGEDGRELFDLPGAPRPPADVPAPPRFLPDYDNLVLGHADRTRVVPEEYKPKIYLSALRVRATFLLDGVVRGAWKIARTKKKATLTIEPFVALKKADKEALADEGERLLAFAEEDAGSREIAFEKP